MKIKICGITCLDDALFAADLGVDALGFNFYPGSQRYIDPQVAGDIVRQLPSSIRSVGLFVNAEAEQVVRCLECSDVDLIQFHGDELDSDCRIFDLPYMKAIRVAADTDIVKCAAAFPYASAILLDTYVADSFGGTGKSFDWSKVPKEVLQPLVLAGGLTVDNVKTAIALASPYAVDVSGGVEASKGKKDKQKMIDFVNAVKGGA